MEILKRITKILDYYNYSRIMLAKKININENTFNRYFLPDQEDKFLGCLWKIHAVFPEISRNWLFFGEGEMFDKTESSPEISSLQKKIEELEHEITEERKLNRQLTARLLNEETEKDTLTKRSA